MAVVVGVAVVADATGVIVAGTAATDKPSS
jgi:hypothetical protein